MHPRRRRRLRILSLGTLALVLAAAAVVYDFRDLPRRRVEAALAGSLGAEVSVGRLRIEGTRRFVLEDFRVERMASQPLLRSFRVARLTAEGGLTDVRAGRFETLRLEGAEARIAAPEPAAPPVPETPPAELRVGRLVIPAGRIVVEGAGTEAALDTDIEADGYGSDAFTGTARFRAGDFPFAPLLALATGVARSGPALEDLSAELRIQAREGGGHETTLDLTAGALTGPVDRPALRFPNVALRVRVTPKEGGLLHLEAKPELPFAEALRLDADLNEVSWHLRGAIVTARSLQAAPVLALAGALPDDWRVDGTVNLDWTRDEGPQPAWSLTVRSADASATLPGLSLNARALEASAHGDSFERLLREGGPLRARVTVASGGVGSPEWSVPQEVFPIAFDADGSLALAASRFDGRLALDTARAGTLHTDGTLFFGDEDGSARLSWEWSGADLARVADLARAAGLAVPSNVSLAGTLSAIGRADGPLAAPTISGELVADALHASIVRQGERSAAWSASDGTARARVRFAPSDAAVNLDALTARAVVTTGGLDPLPVTVTGRGRIPLRGGFAQLDAGRIEIANALRFDAQGRADPAAVASLLRTLTPAPAAGTATSPPAPGNPIAATSSSPAASDASTADPVASFEIAYEGVSMPRWQTLLRPLTGLILPGYDLSGTAAGKASVRLARSGGWHGEGGVTVRGSGFSSADGARALQGLDTDWRWRAEAASDLSRLRVDADARVRGFELLWESLFADGRGLDSILEASCDVTGPLSGSPAWEGQARWTLPDGPVLSGSVTVPSAGPVAWRLAARADDLSTTVRRYLRAPLGESVPFFSRVEAAGVADVEASGSWARPQERDGAAENHLEGRVRLRNVRLVGTEGLVEVTGLELDLPVDLRWPAGGTPATPSLRGTPRTGRVRFESLSVGGLDLPPTTSAVRTEGDSVTLDEALAVAVLGGRVLFERVRFHELLSPRRRMEGSVVVTGVRMDRTAAAFGLPPLTGEMNAVFPAFLLTPDTFHVEGGGEMSIFGGLVKVGDISGVDILSRYPELTFSATFRDIDLAKVTQTFDFGEMTGILQGQIRDCLLYKGTPVRFEAQVETLTRGPRTINVKAVNNLAILGTGGGAGVLGRGLTRFIHRFTYEGLGMSLSLDEDQFLLQGLLKSKGREMFLTGRLPFPIEIVNAQPGTPISFSEMLSRLKSLDLGAATTNRDTLAAPAEEH